MSFPTARLTLSECKDSPLSVSLFLLILPLSHTRMHAHTHIPNQWFRVWLCKRALSNGPDSPFKEPDSCGNQAELAPSAWRCHSRNGSDTSTILSETNVILSYVLTWGWQPLLQAWVSSQMFYFYFPLPKISQLCLLTSLRIYTWKQ